jgi:hypothetical protein
MKCFLFFTVDQLNILNKEKEEKEIAQSRLLIDSSSFSTFEIFEDKCSQFI